MTCHDWSLRESNDRANWRGPAVLPPSPLTTYQPACKPGSVWPAARAANVTAIPLARRLPGASSNLPERLIRTDSGSVLQSRIWSHAVPIRSCSRWGLPCRFRCRKRGALLPHRFTLAAAVRNARRGGLFSVALSLNCPEGPFAGRYPAPFVHGARTFLPGRLSALARSGRPAD